MCVCVCVKIANVFFFIWKNEYKRLDIYPVCVELILWSLSLSLSGYYDHFPKRQQPRDLYRILKMCKESENNKEFPYERITKLMFQRFFHKKIFFFFIELNNEFCVCVWMDQPIIKLRNVNEILKNKKKQISFARIGKGKRLQ